MPTEVNAPPISSDGHRVAVLIPLLLRQGGEWAPEPGLADALDRKLLRWEIFVCVDEGTPDLEVKGAKLVRSREGRGGKGESLRAGIFKALGWKADAVVFTDAGAFTPEQIAEVGAMAVIEKAVVANRSHSGHRQDLYRRLLHQAVKRLIPPFGVDTQSGLKGFSTAVLKDAVRARPVIFRGRYEYDFRLFRWLSGTAGIKPVQVPFEEREGSGGVTQVRPLADLWPCFKAILLEKRPT